tara:strand:- start:286 stop:435 length:150 start_codon:yes stop_codon:yes gene_type:complete
MAKPYLEYTDKDGVKTKLEFEGEGIKASSEELSTFYENCIKQHDPTAIT